MELVTERESLPAEVVFGVFDSVLDLATEWHHRYPRYPKGFTGFQKKDEQGA